MRRFPTGLLPPLFYLLLTLAVTWPLSLHLADRVPGWYVADNYEYLWKMSWVRQALFDPGTNPLFAPHISYPTGFHLAHAELTPLHTVLALPLTAMLGEIVSYNLMAMFSFVLTGWATYRLVLRWTGSPPAGLLSGVVLTLTPYHTVRYGGILPLMAIQGLPLTLLGLELWLEQRSLRALAVVGLGYLLAAWASIYYAFGMLLVGGLYLVLRMRSHRAPLPASRELMGLVAVVAVVLIPLALPYLDLSNQSSLAIPLDETDFWSASLTDYLVPPGLHPLWGQFVQTRLLGVPADFPQIGLEFVLGVGWVALLFAIYGWRRSQLPAGRALIGLTLLALVLSFGPRLHLGRHPLLLPLGERLTDGFNTAMDTIGQSLPTGESYQPLEDQGVALPLPALLLRWLIPPLAGMRAWNRFAVFVALGVSLLAGLGYAAWERLELKPSQRARTVAIAAALGLSLFELWPGEIPLQPVEARPVDYWLADQPGEFTIMELPLTSALSARQLYYTQIHGKRIAFSYGTFYPYWYRQQYPALQDCPHASCLELLRSWGVRYVLLNLEAAPDGPELRLRLDRSVALREVTQLEGIVVYRLDG